MADIQRDEQFESIIQILDNSNIFPTIAEMLTSFAHLGFANKTRLKLKKPQGNIKEATFASRDLMSDIHLIALADTKNPKIILDDYECIKIFEEYANGGLSIVAADIKDNLRSDPEGAETLITYIHKKFAELDIGSDEEITLGA